MTTEEKFIDAALKFQGCHYIWGGKGDKIFKDGKLGPHQFTEVNDVTKPLRIFDCSGLVTACLCIATDGALDLRGSHGAIDILAHFPITEAREDGCLFLYPGHVSIDLGRGLVIEASRGDHTTISIVAAMQRRARVEVHRNPRPTSSLLGVRRIPVDRSELRK